MPAEAEPPPKLPGRVLSSAQFWALMERWKVPDAVALEFIQFLGKDREVRQAAPIQVHDQQGRLTSYMAEIDAAMEATERDPA